MSQVTIKIGGRSFDVVCQEGEENYLKTAAAMLDEEAQKLESAGARITESRMLLMAGLLLADRTAASEEKLSKTNNTPFYEAPNSEIMESDSILDAKLKADEKARWQFKMKQYADKIAMQKEQIRIAEEKGKRDDTYRENQSQRDAISQEKQSTRNYELDKIRANSYREIAVEQAKNQPKTVTYNNIYWR